ncbi:Hypothetical protein AAM4_2096 [Actinomyces succiniciruminis]|uniref:Uncharacterized protein n=1 Tax=Actinomyces succiniciruminis TaxID=1522002 RepID=A0A1L7RQV0_9ACTO|nr:Hypothetical protein AAM4_2096 [Actinomyces succiniciruminis]
MNLEWTLEELCRSGRHTRSCWPTAAAAVGARCSGADLPVTVSHAHPLFTVGRPLYAPRFWATRAVLLPTKSYLATNTSLPFSVVFSALMVPVISSPVTVSTPSA